MSKEKQIEKMDCKKCLHYKMCLENFRGAKKEGLWELTDELEYFSHADECDFYAAGYRKSEWISVEERLPDKNTFVLVWCGNVAFCQHLIKNIWFTGVGYVSGEITHWMPLPEPPKMKGEKNG